MKRHSKLVAALGGVWLLLGARASAEPLGDKTLVAWVAPANLVQRGGSPLSLLTSDDRFDGIVFGELAPARWMAGSDSFARTHREQDAWPAETAAPGTFVQMAIVYRGREVTLFRDARPWASYTISQPLEFGDDRLVLLGLRHFGAAQGLFYGAVDDARIYSTALTGPELSQLRANEPSTPKPMAWWNFEHDAQDAGGAFRQSELVGDAVIHEGKLVLSGGFLVATGDRAEARVERWRMEQRLRAEVEHTERLVAASRELRDKLQRHPHRPRWHFVAPEGMAMPFDPNGAIYWHGRYHLFYIYQDARGHCWGHASSRDLVHWIHHPTPLAPEPGDVDRGMFSGNAFLNSSGVPTIMYHGVEAGNCLALAEDDELLNWRKVAYNPIVPIPRPGQAEYGKYESWDPHGWREGDRYYAIFGGRKPTLFRSTDLMKWDFCGPFLQTDREWVDGDEDISCPDFFRFGDRWMLLCISHKVGARYYLGRWENERFIPESHARMNWPGGTFFAPESLLDHRGRRIVWAWVLDRRNHDLARASGSAAEMSLPRVLSPHDGGVRIEPAPELEVLRLPPQPIERRALTPRGEQPLENVRGDSLELNLEFELGDAAEVGVTLRVTPDGAERTTLSYDRSAKLLRIDFSRASLDPHLHYASYIFPPGGPNPVVQQQEAPLELAAGEKLRLRVFLDRSMLEVFANERQAMTQRIYPTRPDAQEVQVFARGGSAQVEGTAWQMAPANPW